MGAALLTLAGLSAGLLSAAGMRRRAAETECLCRMLELILFELRRFRTPLPELFSALSGRLDGEAGLLCGRMALSLAGGERFAPAWERACRDLAPAERELMLPLGAVLGAYGAEEAEAAASAALEDMRRLSDRQKGALRERCRLSVGLMTAGALLTAVLLW